MSNTSEAGVLYTEDHGLTAMTPYVASLWSYERRSRVRMGASRCGAVCQHCETRWWRAPLDRVAFRQLARPRPGSYNFMPDASQSTTWRGATASVVNSSSDVTSG